MTSCDTLEFPNLVGKECVHTWAHNFHILQTIMSLIIDQFKLNIQCDNKLF